MAGSGYRNRILRTNYLTNYLEHSQQLLIAFANGRFKLIGQNEIRRGQAVADLFTDLQDCLTLTKVNITLTGHATGHLRSWDSRTGAMFQQSRLHNEEIYELVHHPVLELGLA